MAQVASPVLLNVWSEYLFDALEQRSMRRFLLMVGALAVIIVASMAVNSAHLLVKRRLQLGWRTWLTHRISGHWMTEGHHYQVTHLPGEHDNPDGRIAEDARIGTEYALDLAHSLVYCLLLLVSFTKILWFLSGPPLIAIDGVHLFIPGHLVWAALIYAALGTSVAVWLGRPLVRAVNTRQTFEANFRFGLVHARENSEAIALIRGEERERRHLSRLFVDVAAGFRLQTKALAKLTMFTSGYSVLSAAVPILLVAPRYISGSITLGGLMQTAQAFTQMEQALSWPIDNLARVAEWRASVERVLSLHDGLERVAVPVADGDSEHIMVTKGERPTLNFERLAIHNPDGHRVICDFSAEIGVGEHVLISGDPGAAIKLFKVVAELWPWGHGQVELPDSANIFFMPEHPYLPAGTLRASVSYPASHNHFEDETIIAALTAVELDYMVPHIEEMNAWGKVLTTAEQQRLGFARLLLHKPNWIFIQEATDALDTEGEEAMMRLVQSDLPDATVLTVGYHSGLEAFHQRKLVLLREADGLILITDRRQTPRPGPRRTPARYYSQMVNLARKDDLFE